MLASSLRGLAAMADKDDIGRQLQRPGHSAELDRTIW